MIAEIRASFVLVQFFFLQIKVQFIFYTIVFTLVREELKAV